MLEQDARAVLHAAEISGVNCDVFRPEMVMEYVQDTEVSSAVEGEEEGRREAGLIVGFNEGW